MPNYAYLIREELEKTLTNKTSLTYTILSTILDDTAKSFDKAIEATDYELQINRFLFVCSVLIDLRFSLLKESEFNEYFKNPFDVEGSTKDSVTGNPYSYVDFLNSILKCKNKTLPKFLPLNFTKNNKFFTQVKNKDFDYGHIIKRSTLSTNLYLKNKETDRAEKSFPIYTNIEEDYYFNEDVPFKSPNGYVWLALHDDFYDYILANGGTDEKVNAAHDYIGKARFPYNDKIEQLYKPSSTTEIYYYVRIKKNTWKTSHIFQPNSLSANWANTLVFYISYLKDFEHGKSCNFYSSKSGNERISPSISINRHYFSIEKLGYLKNDRNLGDRHKIIDIALERLKPKYA